MAERFDDLTKRVETIDTKLDRLSDRVETVETKLDRSSASADRRFDDVLVAIVEQREYTEFAFTRLEAKMDGGFSRIERKLDQFIDVQLQANQAMDRRLRALEDERRQGSTGLS